jgi:spore coat polysaccharide biosynthesis predicted glycosyltransferase SpsG
MTSLISKLTVILKDDEHTFKQDFLITDSYSVSYEDECVKHCVKEAESKAKFVPDETMVRISFNL